MLVLLSFPPSNDCDLARWVLGHYGVAFTEENHTAPFLEKRSRAVGGAGGFPTAFEGTTVLNGMDAILSHFEALAPQERKLCTEAALVLWQKFHGTIGFSAARWAYDALLPHYCLMAGPLSRECPFLEKVFMRVAYPIVAKGIRKFLDIPEDASVELAKVRATFDEVGALLADGRKYLVEDAPTIADFGFAAMAVPAVWPPEYPALPPFDDAPEALRATVTELRAHPAGAFALRMYRDHRPST